jgi:hypothetical protein
MDTNDDQKQDDAVQDEFRSRHEPVQSDRRVEDSGEFPPQIDADVSIGESPEERGVLRDEQSR